MALRALVVEDEAPAREELRYRLEEIDAAAEVELAATGMEALRLLRQQRFDVVFADIQMPGLSGLELVELTNALTDPPAVVFVTAYDEYALPAFGLGAVDYLMKPVAPARLRETLERVQRRQGRPSPDSAAADPAGGSPAPLLDRLPVETAGRTVLLDIAEIRYAEARDDIVYVRTYDRLYPTRFSLHELESRLPTPPFLRIHRAVVANMRRVAEIRPYFNGAYLLRVDDAASTELTVSRGRFKDLRALLGL